MAKRKLKEPEVQKLLWYKYIRAHPYLFMNLYYFDWESDFLLFSTSDLVWELEIKGNRSDFRDDFKKMDKHDKLKAGKDCPNKFFYVAVDGLIPREEVPDYAGLMVITDRNKIVVDKRAPLLHKDIHDPKDAFKHLYHRYYKRYKEQEWRELNKKLKSKKKK